MSDAETRQERRARRRAEKRAKKPPFTERMKRRGREFMELGSTLVHEPRAFPAALLDFFRRIFRTIWDARGGGLYACGFIVVFFYLETRMFIADVVEAESIGDFFGEQIFEMLFRYLGESIQNTVYALIWPVHVIALEPPWGMIGLVIAFVLFANFLKAPLERWLFRDNHGHSERDNAS